MNLCAKRGVLGHETGRTQVGFWFVGEKDCVRVTEGVGRLRWLGFRTTQVRMDWSNRIAFDRVGTESAVRERNVDKRW